MTADLQFTRVGSNCTGLFIVTALVAITMAGSGCQRQSVPAEPSADLEAPHRKEKSDQHLYVGAAKCVECHQQQGAAFSSTAHANALAEIDVQREPLDGEFDDPLSMRHYRIYRDQTSFRQEESILTDQGDSLVLCDLPMRYVIGSGHFSRSYLVERDGFLFESPVTWYSEPQQWKLSPGYEHSNLGFQRPAELRCLSCHAGRVETVDRSPQRLQLPTLAIDCERCHGPGQAHVKKWSSLPSETGLALAETIFHPAKATRRQAEDVCAQCHLHTAATVELQNRRIDDFRPGEALADYVAHYVPASSTGEMDVVGHVEQLRLSRCYQADETMSCLTCHSAHAATAATMAVYREKCLSCHREQDCRAAPESRTATEVQDNCIHCHMPRSPTEIPHFAFTHHRIGIHRGGNNRPDDKDSPPDELIPAPGELLISGNDEDRLRGLAYLQYSDAPGQFRNAGAPYRQRSVDLLQRARKAGLADAEVEAALARLMFGADPSQTLAHAMRAASDQASPEAWTTACFTLGATYYSLNRPLAAQPWLEKTVLLRPTSDVYAMLSDCRIYSQDLTGALSAAQHASELAPDRPAYLGLLIERLRQNDRHAEAERLLARLERLRRYRIQVDQTK